MLSIRYTAYFIHPACPRAIRVDSTCLEYYVAFDAYWLVPQPMPLRVPPDINLNHPHRLPPATLNRIKHTFLIRIKLIVNYNFSFTHADLDKKISQMLLKCLYILIQIEKASDEDFDLII